MGFVDVKGRGDLIALLAGSLENLFDTQVFRESWGARNGQQDVVDVWLAER